MYTVQPQWIFKNICLLKSLFYMKHYTCSSLILQHNFAKSARIFHQFIKKHIIWQLILLIQQKRYDPMHVSTEKRIHMLPVEAQYAISPTPSRSFSSVFTVNPTNHSRQKNRYPLPLTAQDTCFYFIFQLSIFLTITRKNPFQTDCTDR